MRLEIPDLLDWIGQNKDFSVQSVSTDVRKLRLSLSSSKFVPEFDKPTPFVGLSTSAGLAEGFEAYAETFLTLISLSHKRRCWENTLSPGRWFLSR